MLTVQEGGNCCLKKRISMDGKSKRSLEVCIRNVSAVEDPFG